MNHRLLLISSVSLIALLGGCKPKMKSDRFKASYAIGQNLGENFRQQDLDLDLDAVSKGIREGYEKKSSLSQNEMQDALTKMQQDAARRQLAEAEAGRKSAAEFLAKNKKEPGVKVTKSGLQYLVERKGTGPTPTLKDAVKCHYRGTLVSGEQFDSSYDRGLPANFPVKGVIAGWTEALQLMRVGEKIKLFIPPELGYGSSARPHIPPNSVLIFEMELLGINRPKK